MTRAVDRLVSRGLRPPVPVSARIVGPSVVDIESPVDAEGHALPSRTARSVSPTTAAAPGGESPATIEARSTSAAMAAPANPPQSTDADDTARPFAARVAPGRAPSHGTDQWDRPALRTSTAPPRRVAPASSDQALVAAAPVDPLVDPSVEPPGDDSGRTVARVPTNPIAARLETAASERTLPEPRTADHLPLDHTAADTAPTAPAPTVTAQRPGARADLVLVGAAPREPAARHERPGSESHASHSAVPPTPSVTIGTIEIVTPPAAPPAPRPLDALASRRRAGRARWTGRAR